MSTARSRRSPLWLVAATFAIQLLGACSKPSLLDNDGNLSVFPPAISFGDVPLGYSGSEILALVSDGGAAVEVLSASVTGDANFTLVDFSPPLAISTGAESGLKMQFAPTSAGAHQATLTITPNSTQRPIAVALTGVGSISSVALSRSAVDFGCALVDGGTASQTLTLSNDLDIAATVVVAPVTGSGDFQVEPVGTESIGVDATLTLTATFTPHTNQAETATFVVNLCTTCNPTVVTLTGTGAAVSLTSNPSSLDFGSVPSGTTKTTPVTVQAENQPPACGLPVTLTAPPSMKIGNDGFDPEPVGSWPSSLVDGGTAQLDVQFTGREDGGGAADWVQVPFAVEGQSQAPLQIPVSAN